MILHVIWNISYESNIDSKRSDSMFDEVLYRTSFSFEWLIYDQLSQVWEQGYLDRDVRAIIRRSVCEWVYFTLWSLQAGPLHLSEDIKLFSFSSRFKLSSTLESGLIVKYTIENIPEKYFSFTKIRNHFSTQRMHDMFSTQSIESS